MGQTLGRAQVNKVSGTGKLRLPEFVTADSIGSVLGWANSIKRQFRMEAQRQAPAGWIPSNRDGDVYQDIADLLAVRCGGYYFQCIMEVADSDKRRGLTRALTRRGAMTLGDDSDPKDSLTDMIRKLLSRNEAELATWLAFQHLTYLPGPDPIEPSELEELVDEEPRLIAALGPYWDDWKASSHQDVTSDLAGIPRAGEDEVTPNDGLWSAEVEELVAILSSAAHQPSLSVVRRLEGGIERLRPIAIDVEERATQAAAALGADMSEQIGHLRGALKAFEGSGWDETLLKAAQSVGVSQNGLANLTASAEWAKAVEARHSEVEERRRTALARVNRDDSPEAEAELSDANSARRRLRSDLAREASEWTTRLADAGIALIEAEAAKSLVKDQRDAADQDSEGTDSVAATVRSDAPAPDNSLDRRPSPADDTNPLAASRDKAEAQPEVGESDAAPLVEALAEHDAASQAPPPLSEPETQIARPRETSGTEVRDGNRVPGSELPDPTLRVVRPEHERLIRLALEQRRYGLAAHLQRAVEVIANEEVHRASAVIEALCIGSSITTLPLGAAETRYDVLLPKVHAALGAGSATPEAVRLLAFAGAVKPALFSAQTGAAEVVRAAAVGSFGSELHALAEFIVDELPKRGGVIDLASLRPSEQAKSAAEDLETFRRQLVEMADGAPLKKAVFQRATIIWREMFAKEGPVSRAIAAIRRSAPAAAALAAEAGEELEHHLETRAHELDRDAKRRHDAWLEGKALEWLLASLRELADLLHGYAAASRRVIAPRSTHTSETREMLLDLIAGAQKDLRACVKRESLASSAAVASLELQDIEGLLEGVTPPARSELKVDALLHDDLLLFQPYPIEARHASLDEPSARRLLEEAPSVLENPPSFSVAFQALIEEGRFPEAAQAAERLEPSGAARDVLGREIADARLSRLALVEQRAARLRVQLDDLLGADTEGQIDPASSVQLEGLIASLARQGGPEEVAERLVFPEVEAELASLETVIRDGSDLLLAPLRQEIDDLESRGRPVPDLRALAERRELTTLRECLHGVKEGAELDLGGQPEKLLRRFSDEFIARLPQTEAKQRSVAEVIQAVRERRATGAVDFSGLGEEDVIAAEALLTAWQKLKRPGEDAATALKDLLTELRFANVIIKRERVLGRAKRYTVNYAPTSDRRDCPVPAFGSAAKGALEVIVVEAVNVTAGDDLHSLVKQLEQSSTVPTLFIVKGLLPTDRRVKFMREARKHAGEAACALLDEAGVLFLASWPDRRRADFFAVALPSGGVQPYSDASGKTSPEMFFGRTTELGELWRPDGSCLVFGGRQLGKTALLEQVRLRHHRPPGQIVVYGSLQGDMDVWRLTASLLNNNGLPVKGHSAGAVETAINDWLRQDEGRRVLILVDEADTYLEAEMTAGYASLTRVRDLMQATQRRCKFVFAGLHNVQRLARAPNSPLLHFGTPLRIGPLFGQDLGEAREMVISPMAAAGIVFENPTLPSRILSAMGFYPSLLQTFGKTLIDRINKSGARLKQPSPLPIVVADEDIQNALEDPFFKDNVQRKFRDTLSLDERYRLITLAMLQRSLDRREQTGVAPSLTDVEVQALARYWWPQGFEEDSSLDAFQGLLQEMVGLGVLVASADGERYAIRSSRIAAMLGGKDQIDRELIELSSTPGPQKLDTGSLRRLDRRSKAPAPLTSRQEGQLFGQRSSAGVVHLALGSKALGLDGLPTSLGELMDDDLAIQILIFKSAREFSNQLAAGVSKLKSGRRNLLLLAGPWLGREMVDLAHEATAPRNRRAPVRVLIAPAWIDWEAVDDVDDHGRLWGADLLNLSTLGRSGLRQWLQTRGAPDTLQSIERLRSLTGGFPRFLSGLEPATDILGSAAAAHDRLVSDPETLRLLGLDDDRLLQAAQIIADYEPADPVADLHGMGVPRPEKTIEHLARLGILETTQASEGTRWSLNPFVATVLAQTA